MQHIKSFFRKRHHEAVRGSERDAKIVILEELFNDLYNNRRRIYKLNFIRGLLFGAGSALGGTVVIAFTVWVLSLFVNMPFIGEAFREAQQSIEQTTTESR